LAICEEEHLSRQGFAGPVAMLYRIDGPNEVVRVEGDYRPRQIDSADVVAPDASDPREGWQTLLSNDDVVVAISRRREPMPFCYRDVDALPRLRSESRANLKTTSTFRCRVARQSLSARAGSARGWT
jgi:hypothetical protein